MSEKKNLPSHRIFVVRNYEKNGEEKASWLEIGVAFPNKLGFSIQLQANPLDGRCVALPYEERPYEARGEPKDEPQGDPKGEPKVKPNGKSSPQPSAKPQA